VTIGLILLIFSMTSAPRHGWLAPETWGAGLLGLATMILFIVIEQHHADPLVPPAIVAKTAVLAPNGAIGLQSAPRFPSEGGWRVSGRSIEHSFAVSGRLAAASSSTSPHPLVAKWEFWARSPWTPAACTRFTP
jgi:hypothetical protein